MDLQRLLLLLTVALAGTAKHGECGKYLLTPELQNDKQHLGGAAMFSFLFEIDDSRLNSGNLSFELSPEDGYWRETTEANRLSLRGSQRNTTGGESSTRPTFNVDMTGDHFYVYTMSYGDFYIIFFRKHATDSNRDPRPSDYHGPYLVPRKLQILYKRDLSTEQPSFSPVQLLNERLVTITRGPKSKPPLTDAGRQFIFTFPQLLPVDDVTNFEKGKFPDVLKLPAEHVDPILMCWNSEIGSERTDLQCERYVSMSRVAAHGTTGSIGSRFYLRDAILKSGQHPDLVQKTIRRMLAIEKRHRTATDLGLVPLDLRKRDQHGNEVPLDLSTRGTRSEMTSSSDGLHSSNGSSRQQQSTRVPISNSTRSKRINPYSRTTQKQPCVQLPTPMSTGSAIRTNPNFQFHWIKKEPEERSHPQFMNNPDSSHSIHPSSYIHRIKEEPKEEAQQQGQTE